MKKTPWSPRFKQNDVFTECKDPTGLVARDPELLSHFCHYQLQELCMFFSSVGPQFTSSEMKASDRVREWTNPSVHVDEAGNVTAAKHLTVLLTWFYRGKATALEKVYGNWNMVSVWGATENGGDWGKLENTSPNPRDNYYMTWVDSYPGEMCPKFIPIFQIFKNHM